MLLCQPHLTFARARRRRLPGLEGEAALGAQAQALLADKSKMEQARAQVEAEKAGVEEKLRKVCGLWFVACVGCGLWFVAWELWLVACR